MSYINVRDFRSNASGVLWKLQEDRQPRIVLRRGKPVAVLLPAEDDAASTVVRTGASPWACPGFVEWHLVGLGVSGLCGRGRAAPTAHAVTLYSQSGWTNDRCEPTAFSRRSSAVTRIVCSFSASAT